jgi:hypothetical protein
MRNCNVTVTGQRGVEITGTSSGLEACTVHDTGDEGVVIDGGSRTSLRPGNNFVRATLIERFSRWDTTYTPAVDIHGVGQIVEQCEFRDSPHEAIQFVGNDHRIERNEIHDVLRTSGDAGSIYSGRDWGAHGTVIRNNYIHDINSGLFVNVHAIYLDDCVSGIRVEANIIYNVSVSTPTSGRGGCGIVHGGGRDVRMSNNVIARAWVALCADSRGIEHINDDWSGTTPDSWNLRGKLLREMGLGPAATTATSVWLARYPELVGFPLDWATLSNAETMTPRTTATWLYPGGSEFTRNVTWHISRASTLRETNYGGTGTFAHYIERPSGNLDCMASNTTCPASPFVDESAGDLRLRPEAIATAGDIPFGSIGLPR